MPTAARASDTALQASGDSRTTYKLPMMPIRDMVIVPGMCTPFVVGRESSVRALEYAKANNGSIFLATQHDEATEAPKAAEISKFGCICRVSQSIKMSDGNFKVLVEGIEMGKVIAVDDSEGFFFATVQGLNIKAEALSTTPATVAAK
jgi:ATP-dependent Lon protease